MMAGANTSPSAHCPRAKAVADDVRACSSTRCGLDTSSENVSASNVSETIELQRRTLDLLFKMVEKMNCQQDPDEGASVGCSTSEKPATPTSCDFTRWRFHDRSEPSWKGSSLDDVDYEKIFPEDAYGEEAGPNARVFRVYRKEAATFDKNTIQKAVNASDMLLVFAGLFAAVLAIFVAQSSQVLLGDKNAIANSLLWEMVQLQRAQAEGTSPAPIRHVVTESKPSPNDLLVNGLWFISLTVCLATALLASLCKEWLHHYTAQMSGSIRDRSLVRQFRYVAMQRWHVIPLIGLLPIGLHFSLATFLAGAVVFLIPRSLHLAYTVGAITVIMYSLYFITNLLPVFVLQCPYQTPLSEMFNIILYLSRRAFVAIRVSFIRVGNFTRSALHQVPPQIPRGDEHLFKEILTFRTLTDQEHHHVRQERSSMTLTLNAITWLMHTSSNPSAYNVAVQAVGGLPPSQFDKVADLGMSTRSWRVLPELVKECLLTAPGSSKLERLARVAPMMMPREYLSQLSDLEMFRGFHGSNNVEGMAAVAAFLTHPNSMLAQVLHSDFKLAPMTWNNVLQAVSHSSVRDMLDLTALCVKALQDREGWGSLNCDYHAARVPLSSVLPQNPQAICYIFKRYDPFPDHSPAVSPLAQRLCALLAMHCFLEDTLSEIPSDTPTDFLIELLSSVWISVQAVLNAPDSRILEYTIACRAATQYLLRSSFLRKNGWEGSDTWAALCSNVLRSRHLSLDTAVRKIGRRVEGDAENLPLDFFEQVANIVFHVRSADVAVGNYFTLHTRGDLLLCFTKALENGSKAAYIAFRNAHVLGQRQHDYGVSLLVVAFISGLLKENTARNVEPKPNVEWISVSLDYLHQPENLFAACELLSRHYHDVIPLARLEPDSTAWDPCRRKLRERYPFDYGWRLEARKASREALDIFFEKRRPGPKGLIRKLNK